MCFMFLVPVYS